MHRFGAARYRDAWVERGLIGWNGRFPIPQMAYTGAVCLQVLTHLAHPCLVSGALRGMRRMMPVGAPLVLAEPDRAEVGTGQPYLREYELMGGGFLATTAWQYGPTAMAELLAGAGFAEPEVTGIGEPGQGRGWGWQQAGELLRYRTWAV